jgi:hypothetical protein
MLVLRTTKVFVVLFLLAFPRVLLSADSAPGVELTVSVFDDVDVSLPVLTQAESRASLILARAGVNLRWLNCASSPAPAHDQFQAPSPCSAIRFPTHLSVRIIGDARTVGDDTFGQSFLNAAGEGAYCNVYFRKIFLFGRSESFAAGEILGHVMAHEIGHLLLGPDSHSESGIMCARWASEQLARAEKGDLHFTVQQARRMRARLVGHASALTASLR